MIGNYIAPGHVVRFCAIECALQMSGEESVANMLDAWAFARDLCARGARPSVSKIKMLGELVEPRKNALGFRKVGVRVGANVKMDHLRVPRAMQNLVRLSNLEPAEWFRQYEEIHPFVDGNGRSGALLFNWLSGTLDDPDWPPDFWGDPRRTPGYGAPRR